MQTEYHQSRINLQRLSTRYSYLGLTVDAKRFNIGSLGLIGNVTQADSIYSYWTLQ